MDQDSGDTSEPVEEIELVLTDDNDPARRRKIIWNNDDYKEHPYQVNSNLEYWTQVKLC